MFLKLNNGHPIKINDWNYTSTTEEEYEKDFDRANVLYGNDDFGRVLEALIYYCEDKNNSDYKKLDAYKTYLNKETIEMFVYKENLIPYIIPVSKEGFKKVLDYLLDKQRYQIIQKIYYALSSD